jgi:hypothetical protein
VSIRWRISSATAPPKGAPMRRRSPIRPERFDYVYYLQHNPDVLAAGVDPLRHFQTFGWKEGRNPNAFFDTAGYLATYADVAAAASIRSSTFISSAGARAACPRRRSTRSSISRTTPTSPPRMSTRWRTTSPSASMKAAARSRRRSSTPTARPMRSWKAPRTGPMSA